MSRIVFGTVHGKDVDGHFFEHVCGYSQFTFERERNRLREALSEAAGHIPEADLAEKYRMLAEAPSPDFGGYVNVRSGPLLSAGRGMLCANFLEHTDAPWLYMTDTDMAFAPDTPQAMVEFAEAEGLKFLAGAAWMIWFNPDGTVAYRQPNVFKWVNDKSGRFLAPVGGDELPADGPVQAGAVGGATMLIHRDLLIKVRDEQCGGDAHWFHHLATANGKDQYGEDVSFCIRIQESGFPVIVHMGIRLGHSKTHIEYPIAVDTAGKVMSDA